MPRRKKKRQICYAVDFPSSEKMNRIYGAALSVVVPIEEPEELEEDIMEEFNPQENVENAMTEVLQLRIKCSELEKRLVEKQDEKTAFEKTIAELKESLAAKDKKMFATTGNLGAAKKKLKDAEVKNAELQTALENSKIEADHFASRVASLESELETMRKSLQIPPQQETTVDADEFLKLSETMKNLQSQNNVLQSENTYLKTLLQSKQEKVERLQSQAHLEPSPIEKKPVIPPQTKPAIPAQRRRVVYPNPHANNGYGQW